MIKSVAIQRTKELQEESPDAQITQELLEDRVILSVSMNNRLMETDFIESRRSCLLPRRTTEYYDVLCQGIKLAIIVPKKKVEEEMAKMKRVKGPNFVIMGYDEDMGERSAV